MPVSQSASCSAVGGVALGDQGLEGFVGHLGVVDYDAEVFADGGEDDAGGGIRRAGRGRCP